MADRPTPAPDSDQPDPAELAALARRHGAMALDTEFMGEGRYRTQLCLVQVAAGSGAEARIGLIDPIDGTTDPTPLAEALADPQIEVVMHAGRQDVALLRRVWRTEVRGLFDTQIAAGFAGLRAQSGYEALLKDVLDIRLPKTASYTRWDTRPLSPEQLVYAREDVVNMLALAEELQRRLAASGRLEWAREECRRLEASSDERDVETLFTKLPRIAGLDPKVRAIAHELVAWREELAERLDRPASSVLNDSTLVELARRQPRSPRALEQIRGLGQAVLRRHARDLIAALERGRSQPPIPSNGTRRPPPTDLDAPLVALGESLVRARALEAGIAYELIAARADLQEIVTAVRIAGTDSLRDDPNGVRTLAGWRRELVGQELLDLLSGTGSLSVGKDLRLHSGPAS
jgi:ribonuclease D